MKSSNRPNPSQSLAPTAIRPPRSHPQLYGVITAIAALLVLAFSANAQTNGTFIGATNAWNTASNWAGNAIANGVGATADFSTLDITANRTVNLGGTRTVGTLIFQDVTASHDWTIGTAAQTLILDVATGKATINVINRTLTINAILGGNDGFTKTGAGTLTLANAGNTLTGGIDLAAGILVFGNGSLGSNTVTTTGASTLRWATGNTQDISAQLILGDGFVTTLQTNSQNITLASPIQTGPLGTGGINKFQAGDLTISGVNTYTGVTRANQGKIILTGGDNRLSSSTLLQVGQGANAGIIQLGDATGKSDQTVSGLQVIGSATTNAIVGGHTTNSTLTVNNTTLSTYSALLGGGGTNENNLSLVKSGTGTLNLTGTASTFTGDVTINGGTLGIVSASSLGTGAKTISIAGATDSPSLRLNATGIALPASFALITSNDDATNPALVSNTGDNIIGGSISPTAGGFGTGNTRILVNAGTLTLNGAITPVTGAAASLGVILDGAGSGTANGLISDNSPRTLSLTKEGTGTWSLTAANSYSGATTINGGRLNITTAQTGGGAVTLADGTALGLTLAGSGQSLSASSFSLGSTTGSTLALNLGSFSNPSTPLITTPALTTAGTTTVNIAGTGLSIGQFGLIDYTGTIGGAGFAGFTVGSLPARVSGTLVDNTVDSRVDFNVTAFDVPKWTGATDANWDVNDGPDPTTGTGTVNWKESTSNTATRYLQFSGVVDSVRFDDTATGSTNVNLTTTLTPNSITVDNTTKNYSFGGTGQLSGATTILKQGGGSLTFINSGLNDFTGTTTISGGSIVVGDGVTASLGQLGTGAVVNNATLTLNRPDDFSFSNNVSGNGTLIKQGAGIALVSGNNATYDGTIQVSAGTLKLAGANALGSTVGNTTVSTGAFLDITGFNNVAEPIQLNGGAIKVTTGTNSRLVGPVTLNGAGTFTNPISTTLNANSVIGGSGVLTKDDAGTVILTEANTYTGGTTITRGILQVGLTNGTSTTASLGTGDITFNPLVGNVAQLSIFLADDITISNKITSAPGSSGNLIIGIAGTTSPSRVITLANAANDFAGNITINGGALKITSGTALGSGVKSVRVASNGFPALILDGSAGNISVSSDVSYQISSDGSGTNAAANAGSIVSTGGDNVINGTISLVNSTGGNGRLTAQAGTLTIAGNIDADGATGNRTLLIGGAATGSVTGIISNFNSAATSIVNVTKDGAGTWTLSNSNTFTGAVAVQNGTLKVPTIAANGTAQPLGQAATAITLGTATTTGTLEYTGVTAADLARPITVGGTGLTGGGVVKNSSGALLTLSGAQTKNGRPLTYTGGEFLISGAITGTLANSDLIIDNATVTLTNATNTYNGPTFVIGGGVLKNGVVNAVPAASVLTLGEATGNTNGTYDLNGFNSTIAGLNSAGTGSAIVTNGGASGVNTLTINGSGNYAGIIQNGTTAQTALTKSGTGTQTLTTAATYTGKTTVSGGTLALSGASASINASEWVQVDTGATLSTSGVTGGYSQNGNTGTRALSGSGTLDGPITVGGLVTIKPGATSNGLDISTAGDGLGILTFAGDLTLSGGATSTTPRSLLQLGGASGNTTDPTLAANVLAFGSTITGQHDIIRVGGTLNLASGSLIQVALNSYTPVYGDVFNIFDWVTAINLTGISGTFDVNSDLDLPALSSGLSWGTDQFSNAGVIYVGGVVPEPGRAALLLVGITSLVLRRRRSA